MRSKFCTSIVQKQDSTGPSGCHTVVSTADLFGFSRSCVPIGAFGFWGIFVLYSNRLQFLSLVPYKLFLRVNKLLQRRYSEINKMGSQNVLEFLFWRTIENKLIRACKVLVIFEASEYKFRCHSSDTNIPQRKIILRHVTIVVVCVSLIICASTWL